MRATRLASLALSSLIVATGLAMPRAAAAAATPVSDAAAVRKNAGAAVCVVSVENTWGIPMAYATGFLMGDGRFVVTDLAAVARVGAEKVTLTFQDKSTAVARQFGLADPALGLVALKLEGEAPPREGLPLAAAAAPFDGSATVSVAGWRWGAQLDVVSGRLWKGPAVREVAARAKAEMPAGVDFFDRVEGPHIEGGSGAPVLGADGTVVGVVLEVAGRDAAVTLAIPAASFREKLLSAQPQLKALKELPAPLWPTRLFRVTGEPTTPKAYNLAVQKFRAGLTCPDCKGEGHVSGGGGFFRRLGGLDRLPCPRCWGEGIAVPDGFALAMDGMAEQGTRTVWSPLAADQVRSEMRADGLQVLTTIAAAGNHFRFTAFMAIGRDLLATGSHLPHGVTLYAEVKSHQDGPDGHYLILDPWRSQVLAAVRQEDLAGPAGKAGTVVAQDVPDSTWVVLTGTILSPFDTGKLQKGVFVLPFAWIPTVDPHLFGNPDGGGPGGRGRGRGGPGGGPDGGGGPGGGGPGGGGGRQ